MSGLTQDVSSRAWLTSLANVLQPPTLQQVSGRLGGTGWRREPVVLSDGLEGAWGRECGLGAEVSGKGRAAMQSHSYTPAFLPLARLAFGGVLG